MVVKQLSISLATTVVFYITLQATSPYLVPYHGHLVNSVLLLLFLLIINRLIIGYFCDMNISPINKAVLITGCDSGFGNRFAKRLDFRGFHVFASCLYPEGSGVDDLKQSCSNRLKVLRLDVTNDESVSEALQFVKQNLGSNVLWAVVNNAGTSIGSAVDFSTMKHFKDTIEVNALGPVRVSKTFLPLLKKSKGRVVNVSSFLGRVSTTNVCPYVMSKHALIAFTECLSLEMLAWGVRVISVEPETFRTPITDSKTIVNRLKAETEEVDESIISSYGSEYFEQLNKVVDKFTKISSSDLDIVVDAMESAITKAYPKYVYRPRWSWFSKVFTCITENAPFSIQIMIFQVVTKFLRYPVPKAAKIL